jgi:hypothetical protein
MQGQVPNAGFVGISAIASCLALPDGEGMPPAALHTVCKFVTGGLKLCSYEGGKP